MAGKYALTEQHPRHTRLTAALTRPADTAAYADGDIIANSDTAPVVNVLTGAALANGRGGIINNLILIDSNKAATAADLELWFFNSAYTATNDNAAFAPTDAEAESVELIVKLPASGAIIGNAGAAAAGNRIYQINDINKNFKCAANSQNLWWALVLRSAYTPVSAEKFTLKLDIAQR
ncbi:hypothetical protein V3O24_04680 [Methylobacter sp. Wu8]|uniref:hypothetical protein n=1 Tax=Methylobacter sp. Wu8 TaxID=3118457 RepID=UPI002F3179C6